MLYRPSAAAASLYSLSHAHVAKAETVAERVLQVDDGTG
jgi:hypothetical protein